MLIIHLMKEKKKKDKEVAPLVVMLSLKTTS